MAAPLGYVPTTYTTARHEPQEEEEEQKEKAEEEEEEKQRGCSCGVRRRSGRGFKRRSVRTGSWL